MAQQPSERVAGIGFCPDRLRAGGTAGVPGHRHPQAGARTVRQRLQALRRHAAAIAVKAKRRPAVEVLIAVTLVTLSAVGAAAGVAALAATRVTAAVMRAA